MIGSYVVRGAEVCSLNRRSLSDPDQPVDLLLSGRSTFQLSGRRHAKHDGYRAAPPLGAPLELVGRHFGAAGTSPYLDMTDRSAALSGGPPALTTTATSLKYSAPMSGDRTINAVAASVNGFEKP